MKILLLGIGNILFADEGIGVHFINYVNKKYQFNHHSHTVDIVDGGTLAQGLIPIICQYDHLILVDTVNAPGVSPGEVYFFNFEQAPSEINWQGSAHEVEMLQTLNMMDMVGDRPTTYILGITPTVLEPMSLGITEKIHAAIPTMEKALLNHLEGLTIQATIKADISITELINNSLLTTIEGE